MQDQKCEHLLFYYDSQTFGDDKLGCTETEKICCLCGKLLNSQITYASGHYARTSVY